MEGVAGCRRDLLLIPSPVLSIEGESYRREAEAGTSRAARRQLSDPSTHGTAYDRNAERAIERSLAVVIEQTSHCPIAFMTSRFWSRRLTLDG